MSNPAVSSEPPFVQFHLTVPQQPVAKPRPRFTRQGHAYTPARAKQAEWEIREAWLKKYPDHQPLTEALQLMVGVVLPIPSSIPKSRRGSALPIRRPDCDNYLKTVLDALNQVAWKDDAQIVTVICSKSYIMPGTFPRWEVTLNVIGGSYG